MLNSNVRRAAAPTALLRTLVLFAFVTGATSATTAALAAGRSSRRRPVVCTAKKLAFRKALGIDKRPTIVLATDNHTKAKEYRAALTSGKHSLGGDLRVLSIPDLLAAAKKVGGCGVPGKVKKALGLLEDIPENSPSFAGNANVKARVVARVLRDFGLRVPVLADDSGLEIRALNGWPGVYTKRALGNGEQRIQAILDAHGRAKNPADRRLRQRTTIALGIPGERATHVKIYEGKLDGTLLSAPQGTKHFPGERLFGISNKTAVKAGVAASPGQGLLSIGQLSIEQKTRIGSRGAALDLALPELKRLLQQSN